MVRATALIAAALATSPAAGQTSGEGLGAVIFYRPPTFLGVAIACPVRHEGKLVVELGRGKFASVAVPPGQYLFSNKSSSVEVDVKPGETVYVRCRITLASESQLSIVPEQDFEKRRAKYEEKVATLP